MATHDYIISNASGASVRADLNNALAAIVSNNSNATSPATTYAFQFWADTTTGQLKIRNAANSAWITVFELDGTMLMEQGTASAPGLAFVGDLNTGIYRPAADAVGFTTGGAERFAVGGTEAVFNDPSNDVDFRVESNGNTHMLFVDAGNDRIGIGKSTPRSAFELGIGHIVLPASGRIGTGGSGDTPETSFRFTSADNISAIVGNNEKFRIDNDGRFLLGTSNPRENFYQTTGQGWQHQIEGVNYLASGQAQITTSNDALGAYLNLAKGRGGSIGSNTIVQNGDTIGNIEFHANDGTDFVHAARISAQVDGAPGANDMPGRITFLTTADGGTSPTERVRIDSSGNVGIGSVAPTARLEVGDVAQSGVSAGDLIVDSTSLSADVIVGRQSSTSNDNTTFRVRDRGDNTILYASAVGDPFRVGRNGSEFARFDTAGRLLLGTSTGQSISGHAPALQVSGTDFSTATVSITNNANSANGSYLFFCKQRSGSPGGSTVLQNGDLIGQLRYVGGDGSDMNTLAAIIQVKVDGTPGADDMPGRIEFYTTADGSNNPTERMRINRKGYMYVSTRNGIVDSNEHIIDQNQAAYNVLQLTANSNSYSASGGGAFAIGVGRTANSAYTIAGWYSGNGSTSSFNDREFRFRGDGNAYADGSFSGGGADYAEYFEWSDGNSSEEDRRGISVVLDGDKIREAVDGEEPIGVISANPSVVGDADDERWKNKYLRNDYGSYDLDENGDRQLNPAYDPDLEYIPRENRPEWDTVGLMGKLRIRKGQVTGARWIKMRDVSATVEEWLVR